MNTVALLCATVALLASIQSATSQGFLVIEEGSTGNDATTAPPKKEEPSTTRRPYSPLKPMQLPPFFQNLGMTLPPPPPPPLFFHNLPKPLELGQAEHKIFFENFFQLLFPWLNPTTTTPAGTTTTPATPKP